jgi:predicted ATPase
MGNLAHVLWPLGEFDRAIALVDQMQTRIIGLTHARALSFARLHTALFELMRGDHSRAAHSAVELARLAREHELTMYRSFGVFLEGWTKAGDGTPGCGLEDMRRGVDLLREQNVLMFDGIIKIALAEAEAQAGDVDRAIAILDEALVTADRLGYRAFEAELHRARGEVLLSRDPVNPAPAEEAFKTAIEIARKQGTRSFGLRAALSLAKLYQSTGRPAEAHVVLAAALEGFSPTPQIPKIGEAQALLAALEETDEVKAGAAQRRRMTQLRVAYGNALFAARGFAASETTQAFARARELGASDRDAPERKGADYGLWIGFYYRGELHQMRALAASFLDDLEARPNSPEATVAHRIGGITHQFAGEYVAARDHLEKAVALFEAGRDDDLAFRFGVDAGVGAMLYLGLVSWALGDIDRSISLIADAQERADRITHIVSRAHAKLLAVMFELMRGNRVRAAHRVVELARFAHDHDLTLWRAFAAFLDGWATAEDGKLSERIKEMRESATLIREQNGVWFDGLLKVALAETEARSGDFDRALAVLDEALATSALTGYRAFQAELHRVRGELLLGRGAPNPKLAEEAFQAAIAIAKEQGARSYELLASLALAKLYQSTSRLAEAQTILAPALKGFAPTEEMPEIAEAQALLVAIESRRACEA